MRAPGGSPTRRSDIVLMRASLTAPQASRHLRRANRTIYQHGERERSRGSPGRKLLKGLLGVLAAPGHRGAEVCGLGDEGGGTGNQGLRGAGGAGAEEGGRAASGNAEERGGRHCGIERGGRRGGEAAMGLGQDCLLGFS